MAGVELGVAYISLLPSTSKFVPEFSKTIGSAEGAASSGGKGLGGVMFGALAGVGMSLMNKAIGAISNSMGAAISRVDTLNAFPKIMQNLGYSASDASASIKLMSDGLQGLPTSLDTMAGAVQVMAPLTSSLEEATNISLALNNALIAGGKSTAEQSNAMDQYVQMLAVGKVDMQAWRTMVSAMPGQMDQLSKSLLGAGAKQTDLYAAMQAGTVTFDQFNQELLKLNSEGAPGFASFAQQAQDATGGIGTSLANLQTAITRNLANVLQQLKPQIDAVVSGLTSFANAAGPVVVSVVQGIGDAFALAGQNWEWIGPLVAAIGGAAAAFSTWQGAIAVWSVATKAAAAVQAAFNVVMSANPIGLVVTAIAALVAGLVYFFTQTELGQQIWGEFSRFMGEAWANIMAAMQPVIEWFQANVVPVFQAAGDLIAAVWAQISAKAQELWAALQPVFQMIGEYFTNLWTQIQAAWEVIGPPLIAYMSMAWENFKTVFEVIWNVLVAVVTTVMGVIHGVINTVTALIQGDWAGVWEGIKQIFGSVWNGIVSIVTTLFNGVKDIISNVLGFIQSLWSSVWSAISSFFTTIWNNILTAAVGFAISVQQTFTNVMNFIRQIPSSILGFFSGIGSTLIDSGRSLIQGFLDGIMAGFNKAKDVVANGLAGIRSLFPFSPAKEGPFSGKGWVAYSGLSVGETFTESLVTGINNGKSAVVSALAGVQSEFGAVSEGAVALGASVAGGGGYAGGMVMNQRVEVARDLDPTVFARKTQRAFSDVMVGVA